MYTRCPSPSGSRCYIVRNVADIDASVSGLDSEVVVGFVSENELLWQTLDSVVADEGVRLYDLETMGAGGLRVTIDRPRAVDSEALERVTSGDCSNVCRRLMVYFQAEGQELGFGTEPQIEVSSPGVNRALRLPRHFVEAVGERVKFVVASDGEHNGRTVVGVLREASLPELSVEDEQTGELVRCTMNALKRASIDFKF